MKGGLYDQESTLKEGHEYFIVIEITVAFKIIPIFHLKGAIKSNLKLSQPNVSCDYPSI